MRNGALCPDPSFTAPSSAACSYTQLRPTRSTSATSATVSSAGKALKSEAAIEGSSVIA
jgi:hypothetical protein